MADQPARRRRRLSRIVLTVVAILVLAPAVTLAVVALTFDPESAKPRIEAAVKQATGRGLALNGPIGLKWSLWPTIEAENVVLANVAGGSRPDMVTLKRLEAQVALLPLLRRDIEIDKLVLVRPDILLETDKEGRPNWRFGREVPAAPLPQATPPAPPTPRTPTSLTVRDVAVEGGTLTWRDGRTGQSATVAIASGTLRAASADSPIEVTLNAAYGSAPFAIAGTFGSLARVRDQAATTPWPVHVAASAAGAQLVIDGATTQPTQLRAYSGKLAATVPDLSALAPFLRGASLPPLKDVRLTADVADGGEGVPAVTNVALHAGASDLGKVRAGLTLAALDVTAARLGDPVQIAASGALYAQPFTVSGQLARDGDKAATIGGLKLATKQGELTGTIGASWAGRPSLRADLASPRIDGDALAAALRAMPPQPQAATPAPASPAVPPPAPAAPPAPDERRIFSDRPIPFALLRLVDLDLKLAVASLVMEGSEYRDIAGHLVLAAGRLTIDPAGAALPAGRLEGRASVDATTDDPPVAVVLRGPGLHAAPLLALFGVPDGIKGDLDVDADLRGAGNTPHALAASAEGHIGLAMINGEIDNRLLNATLGRVIQRAGLPDITARPGSVPLRCFAVRFDVQHGVAQSRALALDTSLFYLDGGGSIDLGAETLALRLRPLARLGGTGVIVPLRVEGSLRKPKVTVDAAGDASAQKTNGSPLGIIIGALGGNGMVEGGGADDCARDLAVARGGLSGAVPDPAPKAKAPKPADILRQFLR